MMTELVNKAKEGAYLLRHKLAVAGVVGLLCVVTYYAIFSANGQVEFRQKRRESQDLERQIKALQQQNAGMEQEIKALKTDPKTIEKEARERLRYARPGEVVFTVSPPPVASVQDKK